MDLFTIINRMSNLGDELIQYNERLKNINMMIFGGDHVTDRPLEPPQLQPDVPQPPKTFPINLAEGFTWQTERLMYLTEYMREMLTNLETFTQQQPEGGAGAPDKSFPYRNRIR